MLVRLSRTLRTGRAPLLRALSAAPPPDDGGKGGSEAAVPPWAGNGDVWVTSVEELSGMTIEDMFPDIKRVGRDRGGRPLFAGQLELREEDLSEHFVKGSGKGGQKVNKTSNCVSLRHVPTGTIVKCHQHRELERNRKEARRRLQAKLEEMLLRVDSRNQMRQAKVRKRKQRRRRRSAEKYGGGGAAGGGEDGGEDGKHVE